MKTSIATLAGATLTLVGLLAGINRASAQTIVTNGSFSANAASFTDGAGFDHNFDSNNPLITGWTDVAEPAPAGGGAIGIEGTLAPNGQGYQPYEYNGSGAPFNAGAPNAGPQPGAFAILVANQANPRAISQNITLASNQTYTFTFLAATGLNSYPASTSGSVSLAASNGTFIFSQAFSPSDLGFTQESYSFTTGTLPAGMETLTFNNTYTDNNDGYSLDLSNVVITAGVPEPSTWVGALLFSGAFLLLSTRRFLSRRVG